MSLSSYSALQTTIAAWLNRANDSDLIASIPDMITLAEAEMNRRIRSRRTHDRATSAIVAGTEFVDMPGDFSAAVSVEVTTTDPVTSLTFVDSAEALRLKSSIYTDAGTPVHYSITGDEIQLIPVPDGACTIEMTYIQKIPALSSTQATNWVLTDHPDIYLYGSLIHAAPFLKDDERVVLWGTLHERALSSLERQDKFSNFGGRLNALPVRHFG